MNKQKIRESSGENMNTDEYENKSLNAVKRDVPNKDNKTAKSPEDKTEKENIKVRREDASSKEKMYKIKGNGKTANDNSYENRVYESCNISFEKEVVGTGQKETQLGQTSLPPHDPRPSTQQEINVTDNNPNDFHLSIASSHAYQSRPKIHTILAYGSEMEVTNPHDDLIFNLVPLKTRNQSKECRQFLEKRKQMMATPVTVHLDADSFIRTERAIRHNETRKAFMKSRIAALRKSPATIVVNNISSGADFYNVSISEPSTGRIADIRVDQAFVGYPRFDPYHSRCGSDCRRCFFLKQAVAPPHLSSAVFKVRNLIDQDAVKVHGRKPTSLGGAVPLIRKSYG